MEMKAKVDIVSLHRIRIDLEFHLTEFENVTFNRNCFGEL